MRRKALGSHAASVLLKLRSHRSRPWRRMRSRRLSDPSGSSPNEIYGVMKTCIRISEALEVMMARVEALDGEITVLSASGVSFASDPKTTTREAPWRSTRTCRAWGA